MATPAVVSTRKNGLRGRDNKNRHTGMATATDSMVIGRGAHGCTVYPPLPCVDADTDAAIDPAVWERQVGKLLTSTTEASVEMDAALALQHYVPGLESFVKLPVRLCQADLPAATADACNARGKGQRFGPGRLPQLVQHAGGSTLHALDPGRLHVEDMCGLLQRGMHNLLRGAAQLSHANFVHGDLKVNNVVTDTAWPPTCMYMIDLGEVTHQDRLFSPARWNKTLRRRFWYPPEVDFLAQVEAARVSDGSTVPPSPDESPMLRVQVQEFAGQHPAALQTELVRGTHAAVTNSWRKLLRAAGLATHADGPTPTYRDTFFVHEVLRLVAAPKLDVFSMGILLLMWAYKCIRAHPGVAGSRVWRKLVLYCKQLTDPDFITRLTAHEASTWWQHVWDPDIDEAGYREAAIRVYDSKNAEFVDAARAIQAKIDAGVDMQQWVHVVDAVWTSHVNKPPTDTGDVDNLLQHWMRRAVEKLP